MLAPEVYERIIAAKVFIDEHYDEPLNLECISGKAFLSPFHFHRLFSRIYKRTPHQYITSKRMEKAKTLLSENRPVKDVCNEVGFESPATFSVLFKKEIGFAPQYYRNMAWLKKQKAREEPRGVIPNCFVSQFGRNSCEPRASSLPTGRQAARP